MRNILEPRRKIPVRYTTDVLVVGGGVAGFAAALASARTGAKTLLIERYGCLGGMATGGLVTSLPKVDDGINGELISKLRKVSAVAFQEGSVYIDPELTKWILDEMLQKEKVKLLFYTFAASAILEENTITAVIIENKSGRQAVEANVFIDATGDGDIACYSGCPFKIGDDQGKTLPVTSMFFLQNVEKHSHDGWLKGSHSPFADSFLATDTGLRAGEKSCWPGNIHDVSGLDPEKLTQAEILLRRKTFEWMLWARKNISECRDIYVSQAASQIGVRETRRILGNYKVNVRDWRSRKKFRDSIGVTFKNNEIPYRCLVPKQIRNLLVVGRCVSYNRDVLDAMRIITSCISTGQAGGVAAALVSKSNVPVDELDSMLIREKLARQDVRLDRKERR